MRIDPTGRHETRQEHDAMRMIAEEEPRTAKAAVRATCLMVGTPGENDEDSKATLDLLYEMERRGLFAILIPSIFTPLHDTRLEKARGVTETRQLSRLQWQVIMKCWKMDLAKVLNTRWGPPIWRLGSIMTWLLKLRHTNGPNFTWPLLMFAGALPEKLLSRLGKIYIGKPLQTKSRRELIASVKPHYWQFFRADNGDLPEAFTTPVAAQPQAAEDLPVMA